MKLATCELQQGFRECQHIQLPPSKSLMGKSFRLLPSGRGVLLHQAVLRGLLGAVTLIVERGAIRRQGWPTGGLHAFLTSSLEGQPRRSMKVARVRGQLAQPRRHVDQPSRDQVGAAVFGLPLPGHGQQA